MFHKINLLQTDIFPLTENIAIAQNTDFQQNLP